MFFRPSFQSVSFWLVLFGFRSLTAYAQVPTNLSLFNSDSGPAWNDIQKVFTPNAYLEVTLAGMAYTNPSMIQTALEDLGNGSVSVKLYEKSVLQPAMTVPKRLWQPESMAGGAIWVAALQDALSLLFPGQNDPAWSPFYSQQAAVAITGGAAILAGCSAIDDNVTSLTIAITSSDVTGIQNQQNNTNAVFGIQGGTGGIAESGFVSYLGFNHTSHELVMVYGEPEGLWKKQCSWLQYC